MTGRGRGGRVEPVFDVYWVYAVFVYSMFTVVNFAHEKHRRDGRTLVYWIRDIPCPIRLNRSVRPSHISPKPTTGNDLAKSINVCIER